jgi:hypothetical protein
LKEKGSIRAAPLPAGLDKLKDALKLKEAPM